MSLQAVNLKEHIGTEVRTTVDELLTPAVAQQVRNLLVQRGVLVFRKLALSDAQQLEFSRLMGTLREEGEKGIYKVTLDRDANARADYLKGSWLWHIDGTHDDVPVPAAVMNRLAGVPRAHELIVPLVVQPPALVSKPST